MKKEYLCQIANREEYTKQIVLYVLQNFYNYHQLNLLINVFDFVISHVDVEQALKQLTHKQRNAVILYYAYDLTINQIANKLQISEPAVRKLINKGINKIVKHCMF